MLNNHSQSLTLSCHRGRVLQQLATMWDPLKLIIHIPYPQYPGCRTASISYYLIVQEKFVDLVEVVRLLDEHEKFLLFETR